MKRKLCRMIALALAAVLLLGSASASGKEALHVLMIGVDSSTGDVRGRSDTMMLASIHPGSGSVRLVSFLRDLYVDIPGVGKTRLNAAYHYGGEALLKETLQKRFGVRIDRTVTMQFSTLAQLVDEIGGIDVEITEKEREHLNEIIAEYNSDYGMSGGWIEQAGMQRLDGRQALCYSRIRKIDSDFQRASRQQTVIAAMLQAVRSMSKWELIKLAVSHISRLETDMGLGDIMALAPLASRMDELEIHTAQIPSIGAFEEKTIDGMMVLVPNLERCRRDLERFWNET